MTDNIVRPPVDSLEALADQVIELQGQLLVLRDEVARERMDPARRVAWEAALAPVQATVDALQARIAKLPAERHSQRLDLARRLLDSARAMVLATPERLTQDQLGAAGHTIHELRLSLRSVLDLIKSHPDPELEEIRVELMELGACVRARIVRLTGR